MSGIKCLLCSFLICNISENLCSYLTFINCMQYCYIRSTCKVSVDTLSILIVVGHSI